MKDETTIDIGKELKKAERKKKVEAIKTKCRNWWEENNTYVALFGPSALAVGAAVVKGIAKRHNLRVEERQKDLRVYDTSLGHYWELKRKLDNRDWTYINRERERGASLGSILEELKVLK